MAGRPPSLEDYEKLREIDKIIDPLREVMFEIIVADECVAINNWDHAKRHLWKAAMWLEKARSIDELDPYYIDKLSNILNRLNELVEKKDRDEWEIEMDFIMPDVIDTVFLAFLVAAYE
jgi:hypothetical protein